MKAKKSLGRGLGAILDEVERAYDNNLDDDSYLILELDINSIKPNPFQPRKTFDQSALNELSESIKKHGLIQPIIVFEKDDEHILIAGERRLRASKIAGFDTIKAIVADVDTSKLRELAIIENIQRENLNPLELAESYKELIEDYGITHVELSEMMSKSRTQITNTMRLLQLSEYAKNAIAEGKITQGHAKVLVGLDEKEQRVVVESIVGQKLSVRDAEKIALNLKKGNMSIKENMPKKVINRYTPAKKDAEAIISTLKENNIDAKLDKNRLIIELNCDKAVEYIKKVVNK